jgi:sugar phosphate isomerase/epimerase
VLEEKTLNGKKSFLVLRLTVRRNSVKMNPTVWKWKIGFHTWSFASLSLEEALKHVRDAGFTEVEITADKIHMDPRIYPRSKLPHLKKLMNDLELHPNSVHAPINGVDLSAENPYVRDKSLELLKRTLEYCRAIECPIMVVHPNHSESLPLGWEAMKRNSIEALRVVAEKAEEVGVKVALENVIDKEGRRFGGRISEIREIIKTVGSPNLGICFDTGHTNLLADPNISLHDEIIRAGEYLWTLHIHDNDGKDDWHLPPGMGSIDWSQVVEALRKAGYDGVFMMEIQERGDPDAQARKYLRIAAEMISAGDP